MKSRVGKQKSPNKSRSHKSPAILHENDMKDSTEYTEGAHDVVGEDARASRDKARSHNNRLM